MPGSTVSFKRYAASLCGISIIVLLLFAPASSFAALLSNIKVIPQSDEKTVVSLQLSDMPINTFNVVTDTEDGNSRCYIDLFSTVRSDLVSKIIRQNDAYISSIRTGHRGNIVRVVVNLQENAQCSKIVDQANRRILLVAGNELEKVDKLQQKTQEEAPAFEKEEEIVEAAPQPVSPAPEKVSPQEERVEQEPLEQKQPEQAPSLDLKEDSFTNMFAQSIEEEDPFTFWGWVKGYAATDLQDEDYEDTSYGRTRGRVGLNWEHAFEKNTLRTSIAGDVDHIFYDNDEAKDETEAALYEAYANLTNPNWDITLGKQRIRWGKGDQISPLDMLNAEDVRQSVVVPLDERKLPSWLLRARYFFPQFTVDAVIDPWIQTSSFTYFDSDWAIYRNLRQTILANPYITDDLKSFIGNIRIHEDLPDKSLENASAALRLSWQTDMSDYAISGRYGWESMPTITSFPVANFSYSGQTGGELLQSLSTASIVSDAIESTYKRQTTLGFEWETIFDQIGFRGEVAYIDKISFLNDSLISSRNSVSYLVAGIDYTSANDWYFNIQAAWQRLYGYDSSILYFEQDNIALLGEVRKPVWRGRIEFLLRLNTMLTDGSSYLQPAVKLKYFTNTEIETGIMLYSGDADTIFGSYDNADQAYLQAKYSF
jgi:hypothetical protein